MLKERYSEDNALNNNKLDYLSWETGFRRGMEYQQQLDQRVINLHQGAKGFIKKILDRKNDPR